jgi:hypothetical protein
MFARTFRNHSRPSRNQWSRAGWTMLKLILRHRAAASSVPMDCYRYCGWPLAPLYRANKHYRPSVTRLAQRCNEFGRAQAIETANSAKHKAALAQSAAVQGTSCRSSKKGSVDITNEAIDRLFEKRAPAGGPGTEYAIVRLFYATDRNPIVAANTAAGYGSGRSIVTYGICDVSIPNDHNLGEIESRHWREFQEDPAKHIVLQSVEPCDAAHFFADIKDRLAASSDNSAFVFVHGYNTTFEDAAKRAAQITH